MMRIWLSNTREKSHHFTACRKGDGNQTGMRNGERDREDETGRVDIAILSRHSQAGASGHDAADGK
jgi:hypothetical protein